MILSVLGLSTMIGGVAGVYRLFTGLGASYTPFCVPSAANDSALVGMSCLCRGMMTIADLPADVCAYLQTALQAQ